MRMFSDVDKRIVKNLIDGDGIIAENLVKELTERQCGVLCDMKNAQYFAFFHGNEKSYISQLATIVALLDYLKSESLIYVIKQEKVENVLCYGGKCIRNIAFNADACRYEHNTLEMTLTCQEDNDYTFSFLEEINVPTAPLKGKLADTLAYWLGNSVYATQTLTHLINNDFKSDDTVHFEKEMHKTNISLMVAIFAVIISLVAPFVMTFFNNCHGISTINPKQLEELQSEIKALNTKSSRKEDTTKPKTDTATLNVQQSINKKTHNQEQVRNTASFRR